MNYKNKNEELTKMGVTIIDINHTYIDEKVEVGDGCIIYPNTYIRGNTKIGKNNVIDMGTVIVDSIIGDNNQIINSYIETSKIGNNNRIGPFANIHTNTIINDNVVIGNFVEIKNSIIKNNIKSKHLAFLGDCEISDNANIGGGVVIANYNPLTKEKTKTIIEENVSIGCNSVIVSPVVLKKDCLVAAGSVITKDIPAYSLAITRCSQINKENYTKKEEIL